MRLLRYRGRWADDEKLFMNGYQTWTACPELGNGTGSTVLSMSRNSFWKNTALTVTAIIILFPSGKKGQSHGFSYCYFRRGKTYRLFGQPDETPATRSFSPYDSRTAQLRIERDCAGVQHTGGSFPAFSLFCRGYRGRGV